MNGTLKCQLEKRKGGMKGMTPEARLEKACYVLRFLKISADHVVPPIVWHLVSIGDKQQKHKGILVRMKDPRTGHWLGPRELLTWGRVMLVFLQLKVRDGYLLAVCGRGLACQTMGALLPPVNANTNVWSPY